MLRKTIDYVNAVAALLLGLYLVALCLLRPAWMLSLPECVGESWALWLPAFVAGLAVLAGGVLFGLAARRGGDLSRNLRLTTEGGASSFSLAALEHELEAGLGRESDLSAVKVTLEPQDNGLPTLCTLRFKTSSRLDLPGRVDKVKKLTRDMFLSMFPAGMGLEIYADVVNFTGSAPGAGGGGAGASAAKAAAEEFAGPVYNGYDATDEEADNLDNHLGARPAPAPAPEPEKEPAKPADEAIG